MNTLINLNTLENGQIMYQKTHSKSSLIVEVRIKWRYNGFDMFIC